MNDKRRRDEAGNLIDLRDRKNEELEREVLRLEEALDEREEDLREKSAEAEKWRGDFTKLRDDYAALLRTEQALRAEIEQASESIWDALFEIRGKCDQLEHAGGIIARVQRVGQ